MNPDQTAPLRHISACSQSASYQLLKILVTRGPEPQGSHRLEKYLNIQNCLEKSLKIKFAMKIT